MGWGGKRMGEMKNLGGERVLKLESGYVYVINFFLVIGYFKFWYCS